MERQYTILEDKLQSLLARVAQINKKAAKWGLPLVDVQLGNVETVTRKIDGENLAWQVREITVAGNAPVINGWTVVAYIEHTIQATAAAQTAKLEIARIEREGGTAWGGLVREAQETERLNMISTFAGAWELGLEMPAQYRTCAPTCEHCGINRRRKYSFLLHGEQGFKMVGTGCVANYTGALDPHYFARLAECMNSLQESLESSLFTDGLGGGRLVASPADYLAFVYAEIAANGWISRKDAERDYTQATADAAWQAFFGKGNEKYHAKPTSEHFAKAAAALAWLNEQVATAPKISDFMLDLHARARLQYIEQKHIGFVAAIAPAYTRFLDEKAAAQAPKGESKHVGKIKERLTLNLTCTAQSYIQGQFGVTTLLKFVDQEGNVVTWFASGEHEYERGKAYTLTATVKDHTLYNGVAETQITRAKLQS